MLLVRLRNVWAPPSFLHSNTNNATGVRVEEMGTPSVACRVPDTRDTAAVRACKGRD
jgi:hypothetical protein